MRLEDNVFSKIKITKNLFYFLFLLGFRVGKSIKTESRVVVVRDCGGGRGAAVQRSLRFQEERMWRGTVVMAAE